MISRIAQGSAAEDLACRYLEARGLVLVGATNRYRSGELDLIMRDGGTWCSWKCAAVAIPATAPAESVTRSKQQRLLRAAALYLQRQRLDLPCRFDVVAILQADGEPRVEWIQDAFQLT